MAQRMVASQIRSWSTPSGAEVRVVAASRPAPLDRCRIALADEVEAFPLTEGDAEALIRARWATTVRRA